VRVLRFLVPGAGIAAALVAAPAALAHGTLAPATAAAGSAQRFELTVPNDRLDADIVAVTLRLPSEVELESAVAEQPRWGVASDDGEVTWSGGPIERLSSETFAFTARLPGEAGPLELTLVETYDDGEAAPFPIRVTVTGTESASGGSDTLGAAALVVSILALGLATAALLIALRTRNASSGA
jgi:uncharacterized protein YcnI